MNTDNGEEDIQKLFGKNVQKYRKQAGLTQEQLSIKLQISQKHMSIIETGTQFASAPLIGKIAEALNVSPAMLFGGYERLRSLQRGVCQIFYREAGKKLCGSKDIAQERALRGRGNCRGVERKQVYLMAWNCSAK